MRAGARNRMRGRVVAGLLEAARHGDLVLERGLTTLAEAWGLPSQLRPGRPPTLEEQRAVLLDARAAAAVLVLGRQLAGPLRVEQIRELEGCVACFRHLHGLLAAPGTADPIEAVVPGATETTGLVVRPATVGVVVANRLEAVRTSIRSIELILTGRAQLIVPTLAEEAAFRRELRHEDLVERGLAELIPQLCRVPRMRPGRVAPVAEAGALLRMRAAAASVAVLLQQPESPRDPDRLAIATALFQHLDRALPGFGVDGAARVHGDRTELNRTVALALTGWRRRPE